jgi:hypothetical protein
VGARGRRPPPEFAYWRSAESQLAHWKAESERLRQLVDGALRAAPAVRIQAVWRGAMRAIIAVSQRSQRRWTAAGEKALGEKARGEKALVEKALGEKALGEKALGEKALGEKALGEKALDEKALGELTCRLAGACRARLPPRRGARHCQGSEAGEDAGEADPAVPPPWISMLITIGTLPGFIENHLPLLCDACRC